MSYAFQVQQSAGRLSTWLNVWRILTLIGGALYLMFIGAALLIPSVASDSSEQLPGGAAVPLFLALLAFVGLFTWVYWQLLSWGKEWVDRSAALVTGTPLSAASHGGDDVGRLRQLDATLGRWIMGAVWATVALGALGVLAGLGIFFSESGSGGSISDLALPALLGLALLGAIILVGVYLPYTALRQFLAKATARLSGEQQVLTPAGQRLSTWCTVLVVFQVLSILLNVLTSVLAAGMAATAFATLFALPIALGFGLLYILPVLAAGRYARDLSAALDSGADWQGSAGDVPKAAVHDPGQMGRLADQLDAPLQK